MNFESEESYIGKYTGYGGFDQHVYLSVSDKMRHTYLIGKTGSGKTTLLKNLIYQDIYSGHGVCVIDPHGDLSIDILKVIPKGRLEDVVYFDPSDTNNPLGFNPLHYKYEYEKDLVSSSIISTFKSLWSDS